MATPKRLLISAGLLFAGLVWLVPAYAECGGNQQCIAVSVNPAAAPAHGTPLTSTPLAFGNQDIGTSSVVRSILVAAVLGPTGSRATLDSIVLSGTNAPDFQITGATCTTGTPSLLHSGASTANLGDACNISVTFNPANVGAKSAQIAVSTAAITRTVPLTGTATLGLPVITSALATAGTSGVPFPGYQITATNNPTSFTASPLPVGLMVNATGLISGTPTVDATVNTVITATNATGTDTETLIITIAATVPIITSATTATGATGVAFSGYQITATNSPTSFSASGLPPGFSINTATGLISGTPTAGGTFNATVSATNATATGSQALTITITSVVPTSQNLSLTVPLNTPTSIDLAPFIAGVGVSGINVTVDPEHGGVALSGTVVTYIPVTNYFGPDAFSYVAVNSDGESPPSVVTVDVVGRPDPSRDPLVRSLVRSQMETAKRFARSQVANVQRRLESLHSGPPGASSPSSAAAISGDPQAGTRPTVQFEDDGFGHLRPAASAGVDALSPALATALLTAATTGSLALSTNYDRADGSSWLPEGTGIWIGGNLRFGTRAETDDGSSLRFTTDGISIGVDRWLNEALVLGVGFGYAWDTTDIGVDGTKNTTKGWSVSGYGSYSPADNWFIDGLIGYGDLRLDAERFVPSVDAFARSDRDGDQVFGSLSAAYEFRKYGVLLSPYGRLDFSVNWLDETTEIGAGLNALSYADEELESGQFSLGLRAESRHDMRFGWVLPRLRFEYNYNFEGSRRTSIAYADQIAGPRFSLSPDSTNRHTLLASVGSDFDFRNGLKLGVDYQSVQASGADEIQAFGLWFSTDLDSRHLPWDRFAAKLFEHPVRVETGFAWADNLNRARRAGQAVGPDLQHRRNKRHGFSAHHTYTLTAKRPLEWAQDAQTRWPGPHCGQRSRRVPISPVGRIHRTDFRTFRP